MPGADASVPRSEFVCRPPSSPVRRSPVAARGRSAVAGLRRAGRRRRRPDAAECSPRCPADERVALVDPRFVGHVHALRLGLTDPRFAAAAVPGAVDRRRPAGPPTALTRRGWPAHGLAPRRPAPRRGAVDSARRPRRRRPRRRRRHRRAPARAGHAGRRRPRRPAGPRRGAARPSPPSTTRPYGCARAVKSRDGFFTTFCISPYSRYIARWCARRGLTPNQVTTASLITALIAAGCAATGTRAGFVAAGRAAARLLRPGLHRRPARPLLPAVLHARRLAGRHLRPRQGVRLLRGPRPRRRPRRRRRMGARAGRDGAADLPARRRLLLQRGQPRRRPPTPAPPPPSPAGSTASAGRSGCAA